MFRQSIGLARSAARFAGPLRLARPYATTNPEILAHPHKKVLETQVKPVTPVSTRDLVSFKAKYTKPDDVTPLLEAPELYAKIHIHDRALLVTEGDIVRLPVDLKDTNVGDTLVLDQVSEIGSRNYTLTGERISKDVFSIKGVVLEKTRVKRSVAEKTRRRRRHVRHVVSNNRLTVIRIKELKVLSPSSV